jgi:uncharacterized protein
MKVVAIFLIRMYQSLHASFYLGACRFHPTCSHYAVEAFESRGFFMGLWLTAYRLVRCQPFCQGGWDPVPRDPVPRNSVPRELVPPSSFDHFRSLP